MKSRMFGIVLGSAVTAFLIGCAQAPDQAIRDAKSALDSAQSMGAEQYALAQFKAAEISYDLAMKQIAQENRKLPFMRKYTKISETLASAIKAAQSAQEEVATAKTQLKGEVNALIDRTRSQADSIGAMLKTVVKNKKNKAADSLKAGLELIMSTVKEAEDARDSDNLLVAKEKATIAQEKMATLMTAAGKFSPAKKGKASPKKK
ncbi:MAG: hypothetical protein ABSE00_06160 [Chitinispirillaceae bacterium]|jgi:hypothetical protein